MCILKRRMSEAQMNFQLIRARIVQLVQPTIVLQNNSPETSSYISLLLLLCQFVYLY